MKHVLSFLQAFAAGALATLTGGGALLYLLDKTRIIHLHVPESASATDWLAWVHLNLGSSLPVFAALLLAYAVTLGRLRRALANGQGIDQVLQLDHLADIWTTLFFGTGVIWTAIGMRSALLFALGDRDVAIQQGAFAMLERMVDGGILLALSTTIFGGVGGYLLRVYKTLTLGTELQRCYDRAARADTTAMCESLTRIEAKLSPAPASPEQSA